MVDREELRVPIRLARIDDASGIAHVQVETWRSAYSGIIANEYLASLPKDDRTLRWTEILKETKQATFVAEVGRAEIVGFVNGGPEREGRDDYRGELYAIYVLPQWQQHGVGRNLTEALAHWLNKSGFDTMMVRVLSLNPFRRFYESLGGKLIGKRKVTIGMQTLEEAAYGWDDIRTLAEGTQGAEASCLAN
jgi:GNAT superfamily N-acetyltransferase